MSCASFDLKAGKRYWFPTLILEGQDETAEWDEYVNKVKNGLLTGNYNKHGFAEIVVNSTETYWVDPLYLFQKDKRSANRRK